MIYHGDCLEVMADFDPAEIDAIVTDPPYGLEFMGKGWDEDVPGEPYWQECYRVAKPGAHLLAFGGTRSYHHLAWAIENSGWEIRDCLVWAYATGFPKSHNLTGDWQGWGTALKPAWEPIVMARKPMGGTVALNVATFGTGALNIDGTRIAMPDGDAEFIEARVGTYRDRPGPAAINVGPRAEPKAPTGRWPANVILTDPIFDGGIEGVVGGGETASGLMEAGTRIGHGSYGGFPGAPMERNTYGDSGTYSRFFLIPKAARSDREPIVGGTLAREARYGSVQDGRPHTPDGYEYHRNARENVHPTVKPVELMRHLVRLVAPPGGIVLDPFLGSGTTGIAAEMEGFDWIGIEREAEYVAIAKARLEGVQKGLGLSA